MKDSGVANNPSLFTYGGTDYQQWLVLIGVSHGHGVGWLRDQLTRPHGGPDDFLILVGRGERVNLAFPGLLLRLADIMDFDATRTPRILFNHIGIDNAVSLKEWNKHLAITGWDLETPPSGEPRLTYSATPCRHPVYEKSIRDFATWIDTEIHSVREELLWQRRLLDDRGERFGIHLPRKITLDIKPAGWPQAPIYTYRDLQFRLDQDEIQQLLMGESLYGDPSLCIRELLQNALDALEVRDLRLKMLATGGKPYEPVDPPRFVDGKPQELCVTLTWGKDEVTGQDYLLVADNGVGMTEEVITRYFTQVGKSYYRSPEYHQERAALSVRGLISSPISIFGIGILSCFMIADRLQVRTCPGGANNADRVPRDITISGPGSLFWLRLGTLEHQGTEITIFLKSRFHLQHDAKAFLPGLREHFGYPNGRKYEPGDGVIDPPFIAAAHVVWPRYPIEVHDPRGEAIRIDDRFHLDTLAPIDRQAVIAKAAEWDCPRELIGRPEWGVWDWEDTDGSDATGSRIRLCFPCNHATRSHPDLPIDPLEGEGLCRQDELAAFVEPQLEDDARSRVLVQGMYVAEDEVGQGRCEVAASVGTRVWIDLRGAAAPGLTADRRRTIAPQDGETWSRAVEVFFRRGSAALRSELDSRKRGLWKNIASGFRWPGDLALPKPTREARRGFELARACDISWHNKEYANISFKISTLLQSLARDITLVHAPARDPALARVRAPALARDLARVLDLARALARARARALDPDRVLDLDRISSLDLQKHYLIEIFMLCDILQEAFLPNLSSSWPPLECDSLDGHIGDATLAGPGLVVFDLEQDERTVHFTDPEGKRPEPLVQRGYDLTFPLTAIPLGNLRQTCSAWRTDRRYPPLGVAPFLFLGLYHIWTDHAKFLREIFRVRQIFALLPRFELWSRPFADWMEEEWSTCGLSALWELDSGRVLWAHGAHDVAAMPTVGRTTAEFFGQALQEGPLRIR
jgi:hypothetical protein